MNKVFKICLLTIITVLIVIISLLFIAKKTVFNKDYIINKLDSNNYYEYVYEDTIDIMKSNITSTGLPYNILDNVITKEYITNDINDYIESIFTKREYNVNVLVRKSISNNIDNYLYTHNITLKSRNEINALIDDLEKIYVDEVTFYKYFDKYINIYVKYKKIVEISILLSILILTILIIVLKSNISEFILPIIMSSGIILLFIKYILYDKINYDSVLIISDAFSKVLRELLTKIGNLILLLGFSYLLLSIILIIIEVKGSKIKWKK